ncbi:MAG: serine/threonine protein kinase, partial [Deltaproteobacteria bacterium]|nr:serine/threonine protein kinase [Deltaproteobacteria bacterium]
LATSWIEVPAMGSLPARRLAARILAHGAREAVRRYDAGDRGGVGVLARSGIRAALDRLLGDREALVWRFACIARGILAHVDHDLAAAIDRELRPSATSTELRRGAASAAAALERGGAASRWEAVLVERAAKDPGVARGTILGLAGLAISAPEQADQLANRLVLRAPLDSVEALTDLRREEGAALLPEATASALAWIKQQMSAPEAADDGRWALLHALEAELGGAASMDALASSLCEARTALDAGDVTTALRAARLAVDEVVEAADWLERATDDDPIDRRHSMRLLRELDRELLADNALTAVLALAPDRDPARALYSRALARIENALLASEARPETGTVVHGGLRVARLRALVRLLDGVRRISDGSADTDLGPRLAAVGLLMARAGTDHSSLRRAVWAALTRAGDALLRDDHAEVTDLLLVWTMAFPDDDFAIVREASMIPEVGAVFEAYARLQQATWAAADPDDEEAIQTVAERVGELADAMPPEQSPRVESVRLALARIGNQLRRITTATSHASVPAAVPADVIDALGFELAALARRVFGAHQRLGVAAEDHGHAVEHAFLGLAAGFGREARVLDEAIAVASDAGRSALPPALAGAIERVLLWLAHRPHSDRAQATGVIEVMLPSWVPLSRMLGGFHVVRPIGRGAGGSVLLAVRAEERNRPDRELVALKVPDYSGGAARNLSEQEFEQLFREEAGALLALPAHKNLAGFITFDASAQPKPLLAMEFVRGTNLEQTLQQTDLEMARALRIIDDLLAGLEAMHKAQIAHLDVKPANVVLREGTGDAVLVDFGLAGRRLRAGCGSVHYAAAEVWTEGSTEEPFGTDVYAAACVAFEVLTDTVLVRGETIKEVIDAHFAKQPAAAILAALERIPRSGPLAELLRAALAREAKRRPSAARLRAGFAAIAPDLRNLAWPIKL